MHLQPNIHSQLGKRILYSNYVYTILFYAARSSVLRNLPKPDRGKSRNNSTTRPYKQTNTDSIDPVRRMMLILRRITQLWTLSWLQYAEHHETDPRAHELRERGVHVHDAQILAAALAGGLLLGVRLLKV